MIDEPEGLSGKLFRNLFQRFFRSDARLTDPVSRFPYASQVCAHFRDVVLDEELILS